MCLITVLKRKPKKTGIGWKVFCVVNGRLCGEWRSLSRVRPKDKWLKEKAYRDSNLVTGQLGGETRYPLGWHVFKNKKDAELWNNGIFTRGVYRVKYRGAHTQGTQRTGDFILDCIVAKKIKILKEA